MHVTLFGFVLFLHIAFAVVAFAMAGVVHAGMPALARARDVATMRPWSEILHRLDPLFPLVALILLGLGSWLVHLGDGEGFRFSDGWIITSIAALVLIEGLAGALLAPAAKRAVALIRESPDGAPSEEVRRAVLDPRIWYPGHIATFGFLGVIFLMAAKPAGAWAPVFPVVGALVGILLARLQLEAVSRPAAAAGRAVPGQRTATDERAAAEA